MKFHYFPISTYSQKALIALFDKGVAFVPVHVRVLDPEARDAYRKLYPIGKIPLLETDDGRLIPESTHIIEFVDQAYGKSNTLIATDPELARDIRFLDRTADLYLNNPVVTILFDGWKAPEQRNEAAVAEARRLLDITYQSFDRKLSHQQWLTGDQFSMADCAAIPPLFYAQKVHPYGEYEHLTRYYLQACERPSYAAVMREAMPIWEALLASKTGA